MHENMQQKPWQKPNAILTNQIEKNEKLAETLEERERERNTK